jgi:hypothetical protein
MPRDLTVAHADRAGGVDPQAVVVARFVHHRHVLPGGPRVQPAPALGRVGAVRLDDDVPGAGLGGQPPPAARAAATGLTASAITVSPRRRWLAADLLAGIVAVTSFPAYDALGDLARHPGRAGAVVLRMVRALLD